MTLFIKSAAGMLILAAMVLAGCSRSGSPEAVAADLQLAREALAENNPSQAKKICDELSSNPSALSATHLAALSIIYMQLSDADDMEDNTAMAYQCYRNAMKADADSTAAYFARITGENARYVQMLVSLRQMLERPSGIPVGDVDSIYPDHVEEPSVPHLHEN